MRINFGSGPVYAEGWFNIDLDPSFKIDAQTTKDLPDNSVDYIVAHHSLQAVEYWHFQTILLDLYRVLKPGGVLRVSIPDILRGFQAFQENDLDWFPQMAHEPIDARFTKWLTWYGQNINPMTSFELQTYLDEIFRWALPVAPNDTFCKDKEIMTLDTRWNESVYVEAMK